MLTDQNQELRSLGDTTLGICRGCEMWGAEVKKGPQSPVGPRTLSHPTGQLSSARGTVLYSFCERLLNYLNEDILLKNPKYH